MGRSEWKYADGARRLEKRLRREYGPRLNSGATRDVLAAVERMHGQQRFTSAEVSAALLGLRITKYTPRTVARFCALLAGRGLLGRVEMRNGRVVYDRAEGFRWRCLLPSIEALRQVCGVHCWSGFGAPPVTREALLAADAYLRSIGGDSRCSAAHPGPTGGVVLEWKSKGRQAVAFGPDGQRIADVACAV